MMFKRVSILVVFFVLVAVLVPSQALSQYPTIEASVKFKEDGPNRLDVLGRVKTNVEFDYIWSWMDAHEYVNHTWVFLGENQMAKEIPAGRFRVVNWLDNLALGDTSWPGYMVGVSFEGFGVLDEEHYPFEVHVAYTP
jgi:hypothetical protein